MYVSRIVIRNFRNFEFADFKLHPGVTCIIGENNTGKTNLLYALRLLLDVNLPRRNRSLSEIDINHKVERKKPYQVLIAVEFSGFKGNAQEEALVSMCQVDDNTARIVYRFRPKPEVNTAIAVKQRPDDSLRITDYQWEIVGGGAIDPERVAWNEDLNSEKFDESSLQNFQVDYLKALRDVEQDFSRDTSSPLRRILDFIPEQQQDELVKIVGDANESIEKNNAIQSVTSQIQTAFESTSGDAFYMLLQLGMSSPNFEAIKRSMSLLVSTEYIDKFDLSRNGLGVNNVIYISLLLQAFRERNRQLKNAAGQLLLIEEPEAHLHPQLQRVLYNFLSREQFQSILTTHSTHISSQAPINSLILLTNDGSNSTATNAISSHSAFTASELDDLKRYLDATRSTLLYARKAILVEGPAELFLIPPLVSCIMGIDLDSQGVSVIPIFGKHFGVYAKLFGDTGMPKKCAVIADGDMQNEEDYDPDTDDVSLEEYDLDNLASEYVGVFQSSTTFELEVTMKGTLLMLAGAAAELGAPIIAKQLRDGFERLETNELSEDEQKWLLNRLKEKVLATAKRFGKARFAQVASKPEYVALATDLPSYISDAIDWIME